MGGKMTSHHSYSLGKLAEVRPLLMIYTIFYQILGILRGSESHNLLLTISEYAHNTFLLPQILKHSRTLFHSHWLFLMFSLNHSNERKTIRLNITVRFSKF